MKTKIIIFTAFTMLSSFGFELDQDFFKAIAVIESADNSKAVGDKGKALGKFQIWEIYVKDANRISKKNFEHKEMFEDDKAREVMAIYLTHYGKAKSVKSLVDIARIHNGGSRGHLKKCTEKYGEKFKKEYARIKNKK